MNYQNNIIDRYQLKVTSQGLILNSYSMDRYVFIYKNLNNLIISSRIDYLYGFLNDIDTSSIKELILFNVPLANNTLFKFIKKYNSSYKILIHKDGKVSISKKYVKKVISTNFIYEFKNNVSNFIVKTKNYNHGILLSGGYESRINASISQHYKLNKTFFTWGHPKDVEYIIADKISELLYTEHYNIRPRIIHNIYKEFLEKVGYMVNMQYAYRYYAIKLIQELFDVDIIWSGWGEFNGYPNFPSEFISYFLSKIISNGNIQESIPKGWNREWLLDYEFKKNNWFVDFLNDNNKIPYLFNIRNEITTKNIYALVYLAENSITNIYCPWLNQNLLNIIKNCEQKKASIIYSKIKRGIWKRELYYKLLKYYENKLNYVKLSQGYYPFFFNGCFKIVNLGLYKIFKSINKYKSNLKYFDPIENREFLCIELGKILDSNIDLFEKKEIEEILINKEFWIGNQIFEIFKLIQIHWFYTKYS